MSSAKPRLMYANRCQGEFRDDSLDQLLPPEHSVRDVWQFVETLDLGELFSQIRSVPGHAGAPAPQGSKRHVGGGRLVESSRAVGPWREAVRAETQRAASGHSLRGAVGVRLSFILPRPRSHYRTGRNAHLLRDSAPVWPASRPDLDKLVRAVLDGLTAGTALLAVHTLTDPTYFTQPHQLFPLWPEWHPDWALALFSTTAFMLFLPKFLSAITIGLRGEARNHHARGIFTKHRAWLCATVGQLNRRAEAARDTALCDRDGESAFRAIVSTTE